MELYDSKFFQASLDAGEIRVWDWKPDAEEMYVFPYFYKMLGYKPCEMKISCSQWKKLLHPDDKRWVIKKIQAYLINPKKIHIECRLTTKSRKWCWVSARGKAVEKDSSKKTLRIAGTYIDFTKQKEAEQSLRQELQYSTAISKLAHVLISPSHNINKTASLVIKYARELTRSKYGYISMIDLKTGESKAIAFSDRAEWQTYKTDQKSRMNINKKHQESFIGLKEYSAKKIKPFYVNSLQEHGAYTDSSGGPPKIANFLSVPVLINNRLAGQIILADAEKDFTNRKLKFVEQISEVYALALHHQQIDTEKLEIQNPVQTCTENAGNRHSGWRNCP